MRMRFPLACLLGVALAVPAIAQSGSVTQYPACPEPPPKLSPAELDAAHAAYKVGVEAYQTGDYQKALDNLKEAFRRDCSKVVLLDAIARAYEGLGNRAEAIHALETYLQRNPRAADAETVQNRIKNLKALMEQQQPTATTTTAPTATVQPTATATETATAQPTSTAPSEEVRGHTAGPWVVVGVGLAAAIAGGIMIGAGQSEYSTAHDTVASKCMQNPVDGSIVCPPTIDTNQLKSQESNGVLVRGIGIAVGAVGVAAIIGGLVWHFVEPTGTKKAALVPVLGPGYAGLSLGGVF